MRQPQTKYTRIGEDRIAYQVSGEGPDLVYFAGPVSHIDAQWDGALLAAFLRRLASFCRLISFDRRGVGVSDSPSTGRRQTWEDWVDDLQAVLDAVGSQHAAVFAAVTGGPAAILFAAARPDRTSALVLGNTTSRWLSAEDYPAGVQSDVADALVRMFAEQLGTENAGGLAAPSHAGDHPFLRWYAKFTRAGGRFRELTDHIRSTIDMDVRHVLPSVHVPTLVLHRTDAVFIPVEQGRFVAEAVSGAKLVELPGRDSALWSEHMEATADAVEEFITGVRRRRAPDRVLATVLFTDIVGSTDRAAAMGDRRWAALLTEHQQLVAATIEEFRGRLIKTIGDGALATFDGPTRAINCARAITQASQSLGIEVRAGLHTGEVELMDSDLGGIAVHIGARVSALAGSEEILVSSTVKDLVAGSGIEFDARGAHELKGVPGEWSLFAVKS